MSSYNILAEYYDELIIDPDGVRQWADFTEAHLTKEGRVLELASGSGAISEALMERGYDLTLSDLSEEMLKRAKEKFPDKDDIYVLDMRELNLKDKYDGILCYNDSINYLTEEEEIKACFKGVYEALKQGGTFLFDAHTTERLEEFREEYVEEGEIKDAQYQWSILSEEDYLTHHLTFWIKDETYMEEHVQRIYPLSFLKDCLKEAGFTVCVYTDFIEKETVPGEKWYFVARKQEG